jgi:hypothetical protein
MWGFIKDEVYHLPSLYLITELWDSVIVAMNHGIWNMFCKCDEKMDVFVMLLPHHFAIHACNL